MKFTRKFFAAALLASTLLMTGCGELKLGTIDVEKVSETPQMKAILDEGQKKMQELQEQMLKDTEGKSEEEIQKAAEDYQRKAAGIGQAYNTQMKHKLDSVIAEISEQKNFDAVVESSKDTPVILKGGVDITEEVVQKLQ